MKKMQHDMSQHLHALDPFLPHKLFFTVPLEHIIYTDTSGVLLVCTALNAIKFCNCTEKKKEKFLSQLAPNKYFLLLVGQWVVLQRSYETEGKMQGLKAHNHASRLAEICQNLEASGFTKLTPTRHWACPHP